jgi:hypothetical protein
MEAGSDVFCLRSGILNGVVCIITVKEKGQDSDQSREDEQCRQQDTEPDLKNQF